MNLEDERKKIELKRVILSKDEMEFKILQRMSDIERIESDIKVQEEKINDLKKYLNKEV